MDEYRAAEREIMSLVDGIQWFAQNSSGVHGITLRDIAGMRLLATWAALAVVMRDQIEPEVFSVLLRPFAAHIRDGENAEPRNSAGASA